MTALIRTDSVIGYWVLGNHIDVIHGYNRPTVGVTGPGKDMI